MELKRIVETSLITDSFHCISHSFNFNSYLNQLSNKTECFSNKNGCGVRHLEEELSWAIDKKLQVISNIMLFETVIALRN